MVNAARYAGSNAAARHSRGVESLTIRPLRIHRFPDEDWVTVRYQTEGDVRELTIPLAAPNLPPMVSAEGPPDDTTTALADLDLDEAQRARKFLFAPAVAAAELDVGAAPPEPAANEISVSHASRPAPLRRWRRVRGHLRIFTFYVDDPGGFVAEFARLCALLPSAGLVVDVRGNGGGASSPLN